MPTNQFTHAGGTVDLLAPPTLPAQVAHTLPQVQGRDSAGTIYVYFKGTHRTARHQLTFPRLTTALRDELLTFHRTTVRGIRDSFTWYDHSGVAHTVHFAAPQIAHREVGPGRIEITLELLEEVAF